jgi:hypothetical protein
MDKADDLGNPTSLPQHEVAAHPETGPHLFTMSFEQAFDLFKGGVMGTKEFRNWLARKDQDFKEVRDADVDNEIDRLARERAAEIEKLRESVDVAPTPES